MPVDAVIDVDYRVPGCPIQPAEFVAVLQKALMGLSDPLPREPMCASCKVAENVCFYDRGIVCLGLVTRTGCGAKCVSLGRPCTGCRGLAEDANLVSARDILAARGIEVSKLSSALELYNTLEEAIR
jgi:coenzyme F420-reducing hydrogenase gamma subunit